MKRDERKTNEFLHGHGVMTTSSQNIAEFIVLVHVRTKAANLYEVPMVK